MELKINKKIGLLSPFNEPNYGTVLQAFALSESIHKFGVDCEYINYIPMSKKNNIQKCIYYITSPISLFRAIKVKLSRKNTIDSYSFWNSDNFIVSRNKINDFVKNNIPYSPVLYTKDNRDSLNDVYSMFVIGSDQTWSMAKTQNNDVFFLPFVNNQDVKASYAPSLGTTSISEDYKTILSKNLGSFKYLSCREEKNCKLLSQLTGKKVSFVLDPTLLLKKENWEKISSHYDINGKYILCYILGERDTVGDFAEYLSMQTNIEVKYIITRPKYLNKPHSINEVGPKEFLYLIQHASYIITDSFHGTIFSINFNKDFYSFCKREGNVNDGDNARIKEMLDILLLSNRFKNSNDEIIEEEIDYNSVNQRLSHLRGNSINYLKTILNVE